MKHVFGPVLSRRLGRSLGVDPVPLNTCDFDCIYCQLGQTRHLERKRKAFFSVSDMVAEIASKLDHFGPDSIDWITFVGSGETTLFSRLGTLIRYVKSFTDVPVAVITNGSLLYLPEVRDELSVADAVLPSFDAGTETLYRKINRPHRDLSFDRQVSGLIEFRKTFTGNLWVEVMLLGGVNDSPSDLSDISAVLDRVEPDEIHISTPTRPPAEPWVEPPTPGSLERASAILGSVARVPRLMDLDVESGIDEGLVHAVLTIVRRHPMQEDELVRNLARWMPGRVVETLTSLADGGEIRAVERHGVRFWCAPGT
ncbi:MAG: radical SAM protein [Acidobacteriota bacterium]|nr:radical SAM protein [Acidobacteriota bacterium]